MCIIYSWKCFFGSKEKAGNKILYTKHNDGFAAVLEEEEAEELAGEKLVGRGECVGLYK